MSTDLGAAISRGYGAHLRLRAMDYRQGFAAGAAEAAGGDVEHLPCRTEAYWRGYDEGSRAALDATSLFFRRLAQRAELTGPAPAPEDLPVPYVPTYPPTEEEAPLPRPAAGSMRRRLAAGSAWLRKAKDAGRKAAAKEERP